MIDLKNMQKLLPALTKAFPKGAEYPAFNPLPAEYVAEARAHYEADFLKIGKLFPDVTILRPDAKRTEEGSAAAVTGAAAAQGT